MTRQFEDSTKICFMNSNMVWGGGEKWHYETACHFRNLGFAVMVITNKRSELHQKIEGQEGILLESTRITNLSFLNPFKIIHIRSLLKKQGISTIILGLPIDLKLGGLAAKFSGLRNIIYRRGAAIPVRNTIFNRFLFRSVLTGIITNSIEIRNKLLQNNHTLVDSNKIHIVYNGIDLRLWPKPHSCAKDRSKKGRLILGNAGRLVEQKGHEYLIRIAKLLKERHIDFRLYIAGSGKLENTLKLECIKNQLEEDVVFLGFVENMHDFLSGLDIYLSTSIHEGSSHAIIEAMAAGKPVIAFNVSSMPELVEDNTTGYLIPFADTQLFTEKIIFLKNNRIELDTFAANAREKVELQFDFGRNIQQIIKLIK